MRAASTNLSDACNVARDAREAFALWIDDAPEGRLFGQVVIRAAPSGGYDLRHEADEDERRLETYTDPRTARELARLTEAGEHRPLKSSPNLRPGWRLSLDGAHELSVAMNYFYPAGVVHWYLYREGKLEVTNYRENAARQSGIYKRVQNLSDEGVRKAAKACCEDAVCLKRTLWDVDEKTPLAIDRGEGVIPCPEPCSVFVSFARRVRLFEREDRRELLDAAGFSPGEREDLAALLEAASGAFEYAREAEFEEPLNERRLRYRGLTLLPKLLHDGEAPKG